VLSCGKDCDVHREEKMQKVNIYKKYILKKYSSRYTLKNTLKLHIITKY